MIVTDKPASVMVSDGMSIFKERLRSKSSPPGFAMARTSDGRSAHRSSTSYFRDQCSIT
jgi:hypothetical protein